MKKKILIAVMAVICLLSVVLAGCSNVTINDVDKDFISVMKDAVKNSEKYETYYIRERFNTNPKNMATNEMDEYMLNVQADDKSIKGVDNSKINFSIKHTKGITEYTDSFIIGQSLSKNVKAKAAKPSDYKLYVFENYKLTKTSPVFTRTCDEILKDEVFDYVTPTNVELSDYTMENILAPLYELTKADIKMSEKGNSTKGKVTTYVFEVIKDGHKYAGKGELKLNIYTDKKVKRIMSLSTVDEKYTLDVMYQGPRIDIANYDNFSESDNQITLKSTRSDGLVELYDKDTDGEIVFAETINPVALAEAKLEVGTGDDKITYTAKITTVESAVNWDYEYTEIVIKYVATDKDGNEIVYDGVDGKPVHYFVATNNIVKTQKDLTSMIPMAAAIVAVIALLVALFALLKIKKQNKELTNQIKLLSGEVDEEEIEQEVVEEQVAETEEKASEVTEEVTETAVDATEEAKEEK